MALAGGSATGGLPAGHAESAGTAVGAVAGTTAGPRTKSHGVTFARANPRATATSPTPIKKAELWPEGALAENPASVVVELVVAVSVWAWVKDSSQTAVFRSCVNSASGAEVISCGTVSENVILMTDDRSAVGFADDPGDGDVGGCAWVLNVYVSVGPDVV